MKRRTATASKPPVEPKEMPEILSDSAPDLSSLPVELLLFPPEAEAKAGHGRGAKTHPPEARELKNRVEAVRLRIESQIQGEPGLYEHPLCICYQLTCFQTRYLREEPESTTIEKAARMVIDAKKERSRAKKAVRKTAKKKAGRLVGRARGKGIAADEDWLIDRETALQKERENHAKEIRTINRQIQSLKSRLEIPARLRNAPAGDLLAEMARQLNELSRNFLSDESDRDTLLLELERYRNPDYIHPHHRAEVERMTAELEVLTREFKRERKRADLLESEVHRLTEQIIEGPSPSVRNEQLHELESLRRDYQLLSQKYDMLVSKNIELSNRVESAGQVKSLEQALDKVRDRINATIRAEGASTEMLLVRIRREVEQLQRARVYLGKALFDLGMVYLRLGRREDAFVELRAARELGVDDPEANRLFQGQGG